MRASRVLLLIICLVVLPLTFSSRIPPSYSDGSIPSVSPTKYSLASPSTPPNATIAVDPNATIDLSRTMNQITIHVDLNSTPDGPPPFNGFQILLHYDPQVLTAASLDFSSNVFTQQSSFTPYFVEDCLDGHPDLANGHTGTNYCGNPSDVPGYTSLAETILGGKMPGGTHGNLFSLTLNANIATPNFSQIQLITAILSVGSYAITTTNLDGYYTSLKCGNVACTPAFANFTWSPQPPKQEAITIFNASSSRPTPGAFIKNYSWAFGDTNSLRPYRDTGRNSTATYIYSISGTYTVTLTITDSLGIKASKSIQIIVINAKIDMGIESIDVQPSPIGLNPGVVFTIIVILKNYGGVPTNHTSLTLWITINGKAKLLQTFNVTNMKQNTDQTFSQKWDSTGFAPNVYRVDAITPLLKNETKTDPNPNQRSFWIQLIPFQPAGSLSLLSTAGIAIIVVGAGGYGVSFLRKRNVKPDDKL